MNKYIYISIPVIILIILSYFVLSSPSGPFIPPYECNCSEELYPPDASNWTFADTLHSSGSLDSGETFEVNYDLGLEPGCYKVSILVDWDLWIHATYKLYGNDRSWSDETFTSYYTNDLGVFCWDGQGDWFYSITSNDENNGIFDSTLTLYKWSE